MKVSEELNNKPGRRKPVEREQQIGTQKTGMPDPGSSRAEQEPGEPGLGSTGPDPDDIVVDDEGVVDLPSDFDKPDFNSELDPDEAP